MNELNHTLDQTEELPGQLYIRYELIHQKSIQINKDIVNVKE